MATIRRPISQLPEGITAPADAQVPVLVSGVAYRLALSTILTGINAGIYPIEPWATATAYVPDRVVTHGYNLYRSTVAHTSGVFATDLAEGNWIELIDFEQLIVDAEAARDAALQAQADSESARDLSQSYANDSLGYANDSLGYSNTAAGHAADALSYKNDAESARDAAAISASTAANILDEFDDRYLGSKTSDPTVDNDGNALITGAAYFNPTIPALKFWDGAAWQAYSPVGGIAEVVEDTSPQLGGNLDANAFSILFDSTTGILDENGNEQIIFSTTASAVNFFTVTNAATGNAPALAVDGDDTNIDLVLNPKGTGKLKVGSTEVLLSSAIGTTVQAYDADTAKLYVGQNWTAKQAFGATVKVDEILERITITADNPASGNNNFDVLTQAVQYYTVANDTNFALNVRGDGSNSLNSVMATGESLTIAVMVTNTATAYYMNGFKIDGASVTPKWQSGSAPSAGNANSIDIYQFTIIKTGSAAFTVLGSQVRFA